MGNVPSVPGFPPDFPSPDFPRSIPVPGVFPEYSRSICHIYSAGFLLLVIVGLASMALKGKIPH
jgi:hypothetical protein